MLPQPQNTTANNDKTKKTDPQISYIIQNTENDSSLLSNPSILQEEKKEGDEYVGGDLDLGY